MSAFESIRQGLKEAGAFSKGRGAKAVVHDISVPEINVLEIRAKIYSPAKTVMRSGSAKTGGWILEFDPEMRRTIDPLMG